MPAMEELAHKLPADEKELRELLEAQARHYEAQLAERDRQLERRDATIEQLHERINVLLARRFGASAEKVAEAQLGLFNEAELEAEGDGEEDDAEASTSEVAASTSIASGFSQNTARPRSIASSASPMCVSGGDAM